MTLTGQLQTNSKAAANTTHKKKRATVFTVTRFHENLYKNKNLQHLHGGVHHSFAILH